MSVLSDTTLLARPELISPFQPECVGPSSVDLHLGGALSRVPYGLTIDPERDQSYLLDEMPLRDDGRWMLGQHVLYLGVTLERISVPTDHVALVHGLSSLGRLGLLVHVTAGLVDAGWPEAPITLELVSLGGSMLLRPGMRIAQVTYLTLDQACSRPYSDRGRYVGSGVAPTPSRAWLDWETVS